MAEHEPKPDPPPSPELPPAPPAPADLDVPALAEPGSPAAAPAADVLPLVPLRSDVVFPQTAVPLVVGRERGIKLIDEVVVGDKMVGLITQKQGEVEDPAEEDLYPTLCVAMVLKMLKFPDGSTRIVAQGLSRARLVEVVQTEPYLVARIERFEDEAEPGVETDALVHHVTQLFRRIADQGQQVPEELQVAVMNTSEPGRLADLLGSSLPLSVEEKQQLLAEARIKVRLEKLGQFLARQLEILELSGKIQAQVGSEITKMQREHFLRQHLKAIQTELGEITGEQAEVQELRRKIDESAMPVEARREANRELGRLETMPPASAEHSVIRTYLDWLVALPWTKSSRDRLDIEKARQVLDEDHFDLEKIKDRILEYLAVRKLKKDMRGPILCFVGPPGTGKTSLGKSIARALGRAFVRISLGGVHDEAEIRGHRRTYVAAMPGRILQGIRKAGTNNPVFVLDEIDKLGQDFRGDPSSALLEVLDPEQNSTFRDHYLDVMFDLSRVIFIATANVLQTIPPPLRDRMEVLELPGYSEEEKVRIAQAYLIPKQIREHGLKPPQVTITTGAIKRIIADYTREAGLRNLERALATVCRKIARARAEGNHAAVEVAPEEVSRFLGPVKFFREVADRTAVPGVATGLAWTPTGGEILFIEATIMPGKGGLMLTGSLGDVMKESAHAALSYIRSHASELGVDLRDFAKRDLHIHVPAGAIGKDGPSAGTAITAALLSLLRHQPIASDVAMTGEITLTGRILPVGGIREKVLAARRAGIKRVILPRYNENDAGELPDDVRLDLTIQYVDSIDEVVPLIFPARPPDDPAGSPDNGKAARDRCGAKVRPGK